MALASAHELRIQLRKANIDILILQKQVASAQACSRGEHSDVLGKSGGCVLCGARG